MQPPRAHGGGVGKIYFGDPDRERAAHLRAVGERTEVLRAELPAFHQQPAARGVRLYRQPHLRQAQEALGPSRPPTGNGPMLLIAVPDLAFLLGAIPFSFIIAARSRASTCATTAAATSAPRTSSAPSGPRWGGLCLLLDLPKGAAAVLLMTAGRTAGRRTSPRRSTSRPTCSASSPASSPSSATRFCPFVELARRQGHRHHLRRLRRCWSRTRSLIAFALFLIVVLATRIVSLAASSPPACCRWRCSSSSGATTTPRKTLVVFTVPGLRLIIWRHRANLAACARARRRSCGTQGRRRRRPAAGRLIGGPPWRT